MGFRSLISLLMVAIPIGATLGVLLGVDSYRAARGEQPLFTDNTFATTQYCQKSYGITPGSVGQQYTLNPNQWGWNEGDPGKLCMDVTEFANSTYATSTMAPQFSVTWQYPAGDPTQPVHAFPNIKLDANNVFPSFVRAFSTVHMNVLWSYGAGSTAATAIDTAALESADLNANVAVDMFLDPDPVNATSTLHAKFEVMVWLARFGDATDPIGWPKIVTTRSVNGTYFDLFTGKNHQKQHVMTWVAQQPTPLFVGDVKPLFRGLELYNGPREEDYLGYMGFGSETLYSGQNVTFWVPTLEMKVSTRK